MGTGRNFSKNRSLIIVQFVVIWRVFALKNSKKNPELINIVYDTFTLHLGVLEHTPWITYLYGIAAH